MMFVLILCVLIAAADAAKRTCYGDINKLTPTGRSNGGVAASRNEIAYDLNALNTYKSCMQTLADKYCIQASVIGALASRESSAGTSLDNGYGDNGNAWGIMQCDLNTAGIPCKDCEWNSCCHIEMAVEKELIPYIKEVQKKQTSWTIDKCLQGGVAAYNFGVKNVQTWDELDVGSAHNDFSNDVIARAQYLYEKGWN